MSDSIQMVLTTAGFDALVNAQGGGTDPIQITQIGVTQQAFIAAPTLDAVPGELKRVPSFSGQTVSETQIHMTAQDNSADIYDVRGFGIFLDDGTLFAAYSQNEPILCKSSVAAFLLVFDVAFGDAVAGDIDFGDATFLYPPATESEPGVAEIATQAEVDAGTDDERFVTPLKLNTFVGEALGGVVSATETVEGVAELATQAEVDAGADDTRIVTPLKMLTFIAAQLAALRAAIEVTGQGLVTGGGDLSQNRVLTVSPASQAEAEAATSVIKALTPESIAGIVAALAAKAEAAVTVTGGGLATGGGDLSQNRQITVAAANAAEIAAGALNSKVVTPAGLASVAQSFGASSSVVGLGGAIHKTGRTSISMPGSHYVPFPTAFPNDCDAVIFCFASNTNDGDENDETVWLQGSPSDAGFTVSGSGDFASTQISWVAFGH